MAMAKTRHNELLKQIYGMAAPNVAKIARVELLGRILVLSFGLVHQRLIGQQAPTSDQLLSQ